MTLRYGSVCSGIEAATVAWHPLGWQPQFFSEIEAAPRAVLKHRWPEVTLHGDFTTIREGEYGAIDLLVGGTPCQSFSVAGLRGGLADDRGNLALEYLRLAQRLRPRWLVWENVPGVLSSNGGRDFGAILGGMVELGYGFAYRVLDAQYVRVDGYGRAVPQRRRRVFVVGHLGDWRRSAAVLFERASLRGDTAPRREAGEGLAPTLSARPSGGGGLGTDFDCDGGLIASAFRESGLHDYSSDVVAGTLKRVGGCLGGGAETLVSATVTSKWAKGSGGPAGAECGNLIAVDEAQITSAANRTRAEPGLPSSTLSKASRMHVAMTFDWQKGNDATNVRPSTMNVAVEHAQTLGSSRVPALARAPAIAFAGMAQGGGGWAPPSCPTSVEVGLPLDASRAQSISQGWSVRRLTPRECERLQGFPDDHTLIPWRGGLMADGPRYKMLGNSMACNVMRWIGRRIEMVEAVGLQIGRAA